MRPEDINTLLEASPFVPFDLHLSDGRAVRIEHRDFVWVSPRFVTVGIPSGSGRMVDREERIALLHIMSIEQAA